VKNFFVSYNGKDKAWAEWIAYQLEEAGYSTVIQAWDFQAGGNFVFEMHKATAEADRTIIVLSQDYLDAEYTHPEWAAAFANDPQGKDRKLVPVRIAECNLDGLLSQIIYIDLVGRDEQTAREALINGVRNARAKPTKPPTFPGQPSITSKSKPNFPGTTFSERSWSINIPHPRNPFFTGRDSLMEELDRLLKDRKTIALSGIGGIGKTQTAVEYVYRYGHKYAAVLWANAETHEALISDIVEIARYLNLPEKATQDQNLTVTGFKHWMQQAGNWLMIFDNADDLIVIRNFLPIRFQGHILLTTRARNTVTLAERIEIESMNSEESALFLLRRASILTKDSKLDDASDIDREKAKDLSIELGGLPLALDQAGAFIGESMLSLDDYLGLYGEEGLKLLAQREEVPPDSHPSVTVTFSLAFKKVEEKSRAAGDLIRACAFFAPDLIPEEIFTESGRAFTVDLSPLAPKSFDFFLAIREAGRFSLLKRDPKTRTLNIHRLVQKVVKNGMDHGLQRQWAEQMGRAINSIFPDVTPETWEKCERLLSHAIAWVYACADLNISWKEENQRIVQLLDQVGDYLRSLKRYEDAIQLYQHVQKIYDLTSGKDHSDLIPIYIKIGLLYYQQLEQPSLAYENFDKALKISERESSLDHLDTAHSFNNLGLIHNNMEQYDKAEPLFQRALAIREKVLGPDHPDIAQILNNLASLYFHEKQYDKAEPLFQRALAIREKVLGPNHPDIAFSLNNLAAFYRSQHQYAQAEISYQRALTIWEKVLGSNHPNIMTTLENYANLLWETGKRAEAVELFDRANISREKQDHERMKDKE
jgi:tetratricopeptide (TPR) repeat protein